MSPFQNLRRCTKAFRSWSSRLARLLALSLSVVAIAPAHGDSVGQVQTTKYFAPETQALLLQHLQAGTPGFQVGDIVNYIIEFTPVPNSANIGAGGYITDYIPAGTVVVGASFVAPDGSGGFSQISPPNPPLMANGWGRQTQDVYDAGWYSLPLDAATVAACGGTTTTISVCNGRLSEVYADTGIFYSTDPRTAVYTFPDTDGRVRQGTNGYNINPVGAAVLNGIIGQTNATAHNYWDAASSNAFGATPAAVAALAAPRATNPAIQSSAGSYGQGSSPFNAASAVAGPDAGYQLDYTGSVGPWQRISYPGSTVGTTAAGPATAANTGAGDVVAGTPTTAGRILSTSIPLPTNTNAVRWAAGHLTVGTLSYVKIALKLTAPVPTAGLINNSEVFGGDASPADPGTGDRVSAWRYAVPSVADNNSNLLITKQVVCVFNGANCVAGAGAVVAANPKIRYRIVYLNSGNAPQTNVVLTDVLPSQTTAAGNLYVLSGTELRPSAPAVSVNSAAVGAARGPDVALTSIAGSTTLTFPPLVSLPPAMGGAFEIDVQTTAAVGAVISNRGILTSSQVPGGAKASANSIVTNTANVLVSKTTSTPNVAPGGVASYTLTLTNVGNATAGTITVSDFLPFSGTAANAATRFNYVTATSVVTGLTSVGPTTVTAPTVSPYSGNPNQQQVNWTFPVASSLAVGATATISFNALVGASVPSAASAYTNDAQVTYNDSTQLITSQVTDSAPVNVTTSLSVTKTVDCIYNSAGTACNAYTGVESVPVNGKVRYKIAYANGATPQTNVFLCDQLPTQTGAFGSVTTPSFAPTPNGPFTDSPSLLPRTSPANAACGFGAGGITFSYAATSLPANTTGVAYFDLQTNAAAGATLSNTAKIVSTQAPGGATSSVSVPVRNEARLTVAKTTSTPAIAVNGVATYTITLTNTGNASAGTITVSDFLPFSGTTANPTTRFNYVAASTTISGSLTSVAPTTVTVPTIAPYSSNANQVQVNWSFGAQTLPAGGTATITFNAQAGSGGGIPAGPTSYTNNVQAAYGSGVGTEYTSVLNAAAVTIPSNLSITKTIDCIYNAAGTVCNAYDGSGFIPVNAKVRYKIAYGNTSAVSAQTNVYVCDSLPTQTTGFGSVTTPSFAPTPSGAFTDSPSLGSRTNPANAACGTATFSYPVIASLAIGATGTVYFDLQTNAAANAVVTNTGKIVSSSAPSGETSTVSATALTVPNVQISKITTTPTLAPGGTATYSIVLTNVGSTATTSLKVYDFLPFSGTTVNATLRAAYAGTTSITGLTSVAPTTVTAPTIAPYSGNANQVQVLWDFGSQALAVGATATITFTATLGSAMPTGSYGNSASVDFGGTSGSGRNSVSDTALVSIANAPSIAKAFSSPFAAAKTVVVNGTTTLTFTLTNPNAAALAGGTFTDDFPTGTVLASTALGGTCSGGVLTSRATTGPTAFSGPTVNDISIKVTSASVPANGTCSVSVTVQATTAGAKVNTSSVLTSSNVGSSAVGASDTLNAYAPPTVSKAFSLSSLPNGGSTTVTLTLGNPAVNPGNLTGISVSDVLPASPGAMTVYATSSTNGCGGTVDGRTGAGAYAALAAGNTEFRLTGVTLAANATCTLAVSVTASTPGTFTNTTTAVVAGGVTAGAITVTGVVSNTATLTISGPTLYNLKTVTVLTDPVNGASNPKNIPGAEVLYSIRITNTGAGTVDNNSMVIVDQIPPSTQMFVGNLGAPSGPIAFVDSTTPPSGISWSSSNIQFSSTLPPGPYAFTYTPSGTGYDPLVTAIRLNPQGTMAPASGGNNPYFELRFKVQIK